MRFWCLFVSKDLKQCFDAAKVNFFHDVTSITRTGAYKMHKTPCQEWCDATKLDCHATWLFMLNCDVVVLSWICCDVTALLGISMYNRAVWHHRIHLYSYLVTRWLVDTWVMILFRIDTSELRLGGCQFGMVCHGIMTQV